MPDELGIARDAVALAQHAGASEAEATYVVTERFTAEARGTELSKLEQSIGRSLSMRVFVEGAKASLTTSDLSSDGLAALVRETVEAARFARPDPFAGLPAGTSVAPDDPALGMYAADVRERTAEAKIEDAFALERAARGADARIVNSSGSRVGDETALVSLANSGGFAGSYRASNASIGASPVASDGGTIRNASYASAARSYAALEAVESVGVTAARRAVEMIGARTPATMRCPVIFERDVASRILADVFAALSAANVSLGNSFLATRVGDRLGSDLVTIRDDGRLPFGLGTAPFDSEGTATRRTTVFERGTLRTFLFDTYYARKLGAETTGNAAGGGIGPTNFYLEAGSASLDELIAATPNGILVLDTIGFATESVTGTYSRGARGFAISGGELAYPIDEFTIAGNLVEMLAQLDALGSDLVFDQSIVSPSFRIAEMTISGT